MENLLKFMPSQLLEEWLKDQNYQHVLRSLDVVAVGIEGLKVLIHLKGVYPRLKVGYIYYEDLGSLPDWHGNNLMENFEFIPLITDVRCRYQHWYRINSLQPNLIYDTLEILSPEVLIIGALTDPILVKLLDFYSFNQKRLLLRRPLYLETSSLRDAINKYLNFSRIPEHIRVIDTNKIHRYLKHLCGQTFLEQIHQEMMAHWFAQAIQLLGLPDLDYFDSPRLRLEACLF